MSASYVEEFVNRSSKSANSLVGDDYEIILVNDGSPDDSIDIAVEMANRNANVTVVDLSRNFGHHKAMMTGLEHAKGELVYLIDSDLEEAPEWLLDFSTQMTQEQSDVVYGRQITRKGRGFERVSGALYYKFFTIFTGVNLPSNVCTARLMTRRYINALLEYRDREVFMLGLWHITGFKQSSHPVTKLSMSPSTYTFSKKISLLINSVTSFSAFPLVFISYLGMFITVCTFAYALFLLIRYFITGIGVIGWASTMVAVLFVGGVNTLAIGVVGIYISKVFAEVKRRPYTTVKQIYKKGYYH
jgi:putative glycosyltransferase